MNERNRARSPRNYRIGIDVGTHSVGLAAVEIGSDGSPIALLAAISHIHDSGVLEAKTAETRLAARGVARRVRRMRRRRIKRLDSLDQALKSWGWDPLPENGDPYLAWRARCRLATERISDPVEQGRYLATALRHMARHRGWRNPYVRVAAFYERTPPSEFIVSDSSDEKSAGFKRRVESKTGRTFSEDVTVAELAVAAIDFDNNLPLRMGKTEKTRADRDFSFVGGKLLQSDNANELHTYAKVQGLDEQRLREIIDLVFEAESPRGSWVNRIGKDPLDEKPRASKASDAFQRFRIVSTLANVRLSSGDGHHRLTSQQLQEATGYLLSAKQGDQPTWGDIGEAIGTTRQSLAGVASRNHEGEERLPQRPPVHVTNHTMQGLTKLKVLRDYWMEADGEHRDALISLLVDGIKDESTEAGVAAWELQQTLSEGDLAELDKLDLQAGRAAYSVTSLCRMTDHMLRTGDDLHEARKSVFGVGDDWVPPADPIGAPVGNPSVDRVLKIIARFILAAESEWGRPQRVTIEHVRDAFMSEKTSREVDRANQQRYKQKLEQRESIGTSVKIDGRVRDSDVRRFEAVQRQNSCCLYCGETITFDTAEMDHIVPRKGPGSTNTRVNLVAACVPCNRQKSNKPFGIWASECNRAGVSVSEAVERTQFWQPYRGMTKKAWNAFLKEVRDRLEQTESDAEIDARSMESVAWMANEIRHRIDVHFKGGQSSSGTKLVTVYNGWVTALARRAAGVEGKIPLTGGEGGKSRLDRRHHAVDAVVITLLDDSIARTLSERASIRSDEQLQRSGVETWKLYTGSGEAARNRFMEWKRNMEALTHILDRAFEEDRVVVTGNTRLRLGNGSVHKDTIRPLVKKRVGDAFAPGEIAAASTPQLWTALSRDPNFNRDKGLPENPNRKLRLQRQRLDADDEVGLFGEGQNAKPKAGIALQDGWAETGKIHHARFYRWEEKGKTCYGMLRVFSVDLYQHRDENLFSVAPKPSWISVRIASKAISVKDFADIEYLGWMVPGDEVLLLPGVDKTPSLGTVTHWKVTGFEDSKTLNLTPLMLASEGLDRFLERNEGLADAEEIKNLVGGRGLRAAVATLFRESDLTVIRRDALGRERYKSTANLPTCWTNR